MKCGNEVDFLADVALVICPLVLLWKVHLPEIERRMVLAAFSASILTAFTEIVYCVFWYGGLDLGPDRHMLIAGVCHIQASALIFFFYSTHIRVTNHTDLS